MFLSSVGLSVSLALSVSLCKCVLWCVTVGGQRELSAKIMNVILKSRTWK